MVSNPWYKLDFPRYPASPSLGVVLYMGFARRVTTSWLNDSLQLSFCKEKFVFRW